MTSLDCGSQTAETLFVAPKTSPDSLLLAAEARVGPTYGFASNDSATVFAMSRNWRRIFGSVIA
jgi:hypothetical protein